LSPVWSVPSNFRLFREFQGILDLYAKVPHRALQLGVPKKQLHGTNVLGATVDQGRFGTAHCVSAIGCWIETDFLNPGIQYARVLPGS
jgi:hypothetical protein